MTTELLTDDLKSDSRRDFESQHIIKGCTMHSLTLGRLRYQMSPRVLHVGPASSDVNTSTCANEVLTLNRHVWR